MTSAVELRRDRFWLVFSLCAAFALTPIWIVKYLPMVDLPQHAALLSIWQHLHDPAFGFEGKYRVHWLTPYLFGYCLARLLAFAMSILAALKVELSLAVVALPLSFWVLFRRAGVDRWWSLCGFPLAFGACFYWGFLNFLIATPLAILFLAAAYDYSERPSRRRGLGLGLFAFILFTAHALLFAIAGAVAGLWIVLRAPSLRQAVIRVLALALPLPLVALWTWQQMGTAQTHQPILLAYGSARLLWFTAPMLGMAGDVAAAAVGALLLLLPFGALRPRREWAAWSPVALIALGMLVAPERVFGTSFIFPRFAVFLFPLLLTALKPGKPLLRAPLLRGLTVFVTLTWCVVLAGRFLAFDEQARDFDAVAAHMEPNRAVRAIIFMRYSPFIPGAAVFLHFASYYQMEKGGSNGFSFADSEFSFIRYRPGLHNWERRDDEWHPDRFRWYSEPGYDDYLTRAPANFGPQLFRGAKGSVRLIFHQGAWWLYRRVAPFPPLS